MVKFGAQPRVKTMAGLTRCGELCTCMIGVCGLLIVPLVAGNALCRESLELPDGGALVTLLALYGSVRPKKRKTVLVILYLLDCDVPSANGVALGAI